LNGQIKEFEQQIENDEKERESLIQQHIIEDNRLRNDMEKKFELEKANLKVEWEIISKKEITNLKIDLQKKFDDDIKANEEKYIRKQSLALKQVKDYHEKNI